jgi:hypothetical protein
VDCHVFQFDSTAMNFQFLPFVVVLWHLLHDRFYVLQWTSGDAAANSASMMNVQKWYHWTAPRRYCRCCRRRRRRFSSTRDSLPSLLSTQQIGSCTIWLMQHHLPLSHAKRVLKAIYDDQAQHHQPPTSSKGHIRSARRRWQRGVSRQLH